METAGEYLYKKNCEKCGSSDGRAMYSDGSEHCFVCNDHIFGDSDTFDGRKMKDEFNPSFIEYPKSIRGISNGTLRLYTYGVQNGKHTTYYYDTEGNIVAEKYRSKGKEFSWSGNAKEAVLFGRNLFNPSPKIKLVITEGEIDALSVAQVQGCKYPVVSLPNGAASAKKDIKKNIEWILKFKEVIIMFDNDDAGKKAAKEVQGLFPPKFCKIAKLPVKDANELLKLGRGIEINRAIYDAEVHTPEEIRSGDKLVKLLDKVDNAEHFDLPPFVPNLNRKMRGMRLGDLTVITSGSGSGKTSFMKALEVHFMENTDYNSGIIHLEENIRTTVEGLVSTKLKRALHLEENSNKDKDVRKCWKAMVNAKDSEGDYRLNIVDTFGTLDTEKLYAMIRFMAQINNCKIIYIDHLTMLVSGLSGNIDERRALDNIMTDLKSLTQELGVHIFLISHLNNSTNGGKPHEEGGVVTVNQLRGSGAIKQLSDNIISLSRNQLAETEEERNTISVTLLKCRYTGDTGFTDTIRYDRNTNSFDSPFDSVDEQVDF